MNPQHKNQLKLSSIDSTYWRNLNNKQFNKYSFSPNIKKILLCKPDVQFKVNGILLIDFYKLLMTLSYGFIGKVSFISFIFAVCRKITILIETLRIECLAFFVILSFWLGIFTYNSDIDWYVNWLCVYIDELIIGIDSWLVMWF